MCSPLEITRIVAVLVIGCMSWKAFAVSRLAVVTPQEVANEIVEAVGSLNWRTDRYGTSAEDWNKLCGKLDEYDIVLAYRGMAGVSSPQQAQALMQFMERGGAVVATGVDSDESIAWLKTLDEQYEVRVEAPANAKPIAEIPPDTNPTTLLAFPEWIVHPKEPVAKTFAFSGQNQRQWENAARVHNRPCVILKRFGRGVLILSIPHYPEATLLNNVAKLLELQREGLGYRGFEHDYGGTKDLGRGSGRTAVRLANTSAGSLTVRAVMELKTQDASRTMWGTATEKNGGGRHFEVSMGGLIDLEDLVEGRITLINPDSGKQIELLRFSKQLPAFLEVEPPVYRGMISAARRDPNVHFAVRLNPVMENVEGMVIDLLLSDSAENVLATGQVVAHGAGRIPVVLPLPADAPIGKYKLTAKAVRKGTFPVTNSTTFKIVPVRPGQMFVDQDGVLLDEGKPFFPIGLYHAHLFHLDEFKDMGINMIQLWSWDWRDQYDKIREARDAGIRAIYEDGRMWDQVITEHRKPWTKKFPFETDEKFHAELVAVRDDPSKFVAMWYTADEASGKGLVPHLNRARELLHSIDEDHPVYLLSTGDGAISEAADVFAVDIYPIYSGNRRPLTHVADAMDKARWDVGYRKPVVAVVQAFGEKNNHGEKPEEVRAMTYLALTHDIQGIMWYCWKETGDWKGERGQGAGWHPETAKVLRALVSEIKEFAPALLEPGRRTMKSSDGRIHAILAGSQDTGRFLVFVNGEYEPSESTLTVPELAGATLEPLFNGPSGRIVDGTLTLKLPALATGAFRVIQK